MKYPHILLLSFLLLEGCLALPFSSNRPEEAPPAASAGELSPAAYFIALNDAGTTGAVDDDAFGGMVDITIESLFTSAGGRTCKRAVVSRPPHEAEMIVLCQEDDGSWIMMPRIWGRGLK